MAIAFKKKKKKKLEEKMSSAGQTKVSKAAPVFMTLSRQDLAAFEFLNLQANAKEWMERVLGTSLAESDIHKLCKDGTVLLTLLNKMFPGSIRRMHPAGSAPAKQLENVALFVKAVNAMGVSRAALFDPLDLCEKKNMMRVLVAIEAMARFVHKNGYPIAWRENDKRNFSVDELREAENQYQPSQFADQLAKYKKDAEKAEKAAERPQAAPAAAATVSQKMMTLQLSVKEDNAAASQPVTVESDDEEDPSELGNHRRARKQLDDDTLDMRAAKLAAAIDALLKGRADTTKLHLAVEQQMQPVVEYCVKHDKLEVRRADGDGNTPLHIAAIVSNLPAAKSLLAAGADVNARNQRGDTPLHLAVAKGDRAMVALLIAAGATLDVVDQDGNTPLHAAALAGDVAIVEQLLAAGCKVDPRNKDGNTPAHLAAWKGHDAVLRALLAAGAKDQANTDGNTPLHFASLRGHKGAVEALIKGGSNLEAKNKDGATALQLATEADEMDIVELMVRGGAKISVAKANGWTPLYTAAYNGNRETVAFLLKRGADADEQNAEGWAPLHAACSQGHYKVVKVMVSDFKAKINIQTKEGTTPLYFAAHTGRPKITELLIQLGADVNLGKKGGWLPLHGAIYNDYDAVVAQLLASGARMDDGVDEIKGYAPIHIAIASEHANIPVVKALLAKGCDINKQTANGATALHLAVFWASMPVVKLLVESGARLDIKNNKDRRPHDLAAHYGHQEICAYLCGKLGVPVPKITKVAQVRVAEMRTAATPPKPDED
jgi:ankyrin repeat protein